MKLQKLTANDVSILKAMDNVVDGIAVMYGEHTEVLLHSLDIDSPSIIKIANGHITGRNVGAPITNLALLKLKSGQDISDSYLTQSANGKNLRSITTIIRNDNKQAIGLLCINSDMDAPLQSVLRTMMPDSIAPPPVFKSPEVFARSIDEALNSSIGNTKNDVYANNQISPSQKSRETVNQLYDLGIFELKDSVHITASRLNISVHSIYRYLREIRTNRNEEK